MAITLSAKTKLLFIGDSITDCGWQQDAEKIGSGYVRLIRDYLQAKNPATAPQVINRGISGDKITDLAARWQRDVLDPSRGLRAGFAPDVLSIKIGVNDVLHGFEPEWGGGVPLAEFVTTYRDILKQLRDALPACKLVFCEPTVIWPPAPEQGNERLKPFVKAVNDLAREFRAECVVPLHSAFNNARVARPDIDWCPDGVHPSSSGHMLIARTWLAATGLL